LHPSLHAARFRHCPGQFLSKLLNGEAGNVFSADELLFVDIEFSHRN
jgi:hypothetical protein